MYNRLKSQKSSIKVGLNNIANNTRSRVLIPQQNAESAKKIDLNNNSISSPVSMSNMAHLSTASLVLDDSSTNSDISRSISNDSTTISINAYSMENNEKNNIKRKSNKSKIKPIDEVTDPVCITYVKSMWEKYSDEIGTENGPLRHTYENTEVYPHLNGFVAFDMEHWWAERSISCMINDKNNNNEIKQDNKNSFNNKETNNLNFFNLKLNPRSSTQKSLQNITISHAIIC